MKNFSVKDNTIGKEYWISRSIAVVIMLFAFDENSNLFVLATKRGIGTPDPEYVGSYCLPCGYLEYDETIFQAAMRELKEETGIVLSNYTYELVSINDDPASDKRQNVTFRYLIRPFDTVEKLKKELSAEYSEKDEVSDIRFIDTASIDEYKWAFNHKSLIHKYLKHDMLNPR